MGKILIVHNPVSGPYRRLYSPSRIRMWLKKQGIDYIWFDTIREKKQPLEKYIQDDIERIIVIGGDGTVREVADFLIRNDTNIPMGIIAKGTGNVIASSLSIPTLSVQQALAFACTTPAQPIDAILVNNRYYGLIGAGQGYDTIFLRGATRRMKRRYGFLAYLISFLSTFFAYRNRQYSMVIDGTRHKIAAKLVIVFNILSLRGLPIDQDISPQDGILNVVALSPNSFWDCLRIVIVYLLRLPKHNVPRLRVFTGKKISINEKRGKHIQIDGEVFGGKNLQIEVKPNAMNLVYTKQFNATHR